MPKDKTNLESLPTSEDEFWAEAEVSTHKLEPMKKCEHSFIHRTAREVECRNCHIGFFLGVKDSVKEGHIYSLGQLVI